MVKKIVSSVKIVMNHFVEGSQFSHQKIMGATQINCVIWKAAGLKSTHNLII